MSQQTFWRHDDEWFAPWPHNLAAQTMEVLRRCGWTNDLDVVLGGDREETLESGAGVFRPRAFKAMRQEHDQSTEAAPFVLRTGNELVNYDLRRIHEIAELRFPANKPIRIIQAVTILKTEHARFGERTVLNFDRGLAGLDVFEWRIGVAVLVIVKGGVALAEGAARRVLAGEAHTKAFACQAREGKRFGGGPIKRLFATRHLAPCLKPLPDLWVWMKVLRQRRERFKPVRKAFRVHAGWQVVLRF